MSGRHLRPNTKPDAKNRPEETEAKIFQWMPVMFTFMLANFPAGLVIYWTWNNLLTIGQQWLILRQTTLDKPRLART